MHQRDWVHAGPSPQVAYVVSWLNEAQMKPRCTSDTSAASWDSIGAAELTLLSFGWGRRPVGRGSIPAGTRFPCSAPRLQTPRSHSLGRGMSGQIVSDGTHTPHTHQEKDPESQRANTQTITLLLHCAVSPSRNCCYYAVNFQYPHGKTKTADGWCVMPRRIAVGGWWHVEPSAPPFLLVEAFKA